VAASSDGVWTVSPALAFLAKIAKVEGINPVDEWGEMLGFIGDEAGLEVTLERPLRPDACAGKICRADEGFSPIDDDGLGVDAGAENTLEEVTLDQGGVFIKVPPEARAGFLGVEEAHRDPLMNEVGEDF